MKKEDQAAQPRSMKSVPVTQCLLWGDWPPCCWCWFLVFSESKRWMMGPLYSVINNAPPNVTTVPITFAWLPTSFILIRSILYNLMHTFLFNILVMSFYIYDFHHALLLNYKCILWYVHVIANHTCFTYGSYVTINQYKTSEFYFT